jgi:hypothetical protein
MKKCVRIGIYDPPLEECDNGVGCLSNCLCNSQMGYRPTTPFSIDCDGCGNSIWDVDENVTMELDVFLIVVVTKYNNMFQPYLLQSIVQNVEMESWMLENNVIQVSPSKTNHSSNNIHFVCLNWNCC